MSKKIGKKETCNTLQSNLNSLFYLKIHTNHMGKCKVPKTYLQWSLRSALKCSALQSPLNFLNLQLKACYGYESALGKCAVCALFLK